MRSTVFIILLVILIGLDLILWFKLPCVSSDALNTSIQCMTMLATCLSAAGLIWFSSLSYKNQQKDAFITTFNTYLAEHNRLFNELFLDEERTEYLQLSNYVFNQENIKLALQNFAYDYFYMNGNISRYFILVYRLFHLIDASSLNDTDKKHYAGLLRTIIPFKVQLLIAINSTYNKNKSTEKSSYQILLEKFHFLEHTPLTPEWLKKDMGLYIDAERVCTELSETEHVFSKAIWGDNVYIKRR